MRWLEFVASIRFDLDVGPRVECVTPADALTGAAEQFLARSVFPDSNCDGNNSFIFFFELPFVRCRNSDADGHDGHSMQPGSSTTSATGSSRAVWDTPVADTSAALSTARPRSAARAGAAWTALFGGVFYRQRRDASLPRGYVQQALVIAGELPYYSLLQRLLLIAGPRFGQCCLQSPDTGSVQVAAPMVARPVTVALDPRAVPAGVTQEETMRMAWADVEHWPVPLAGVAFRLPFLGACLQFVAPPRLHASFGFVSHSSAPAPAACAKESPARSPHNAHTANADRPRDRDMGPPMPPLRHMALSSSGFVQDEASAVVWVHLWELAMAHEPVLVMGTDPAVASAAALATASLVLPLRYPYRGLRPYITIQDPSRAVYVALSQNRLHVPEKGQYATGANARTHPHPQGAVLAEGLILGATNPFFVKSLEGFAAVLNVATSVRGADRATLVLKALQRQALPSGACKDGVDDHTAIRLSLGKHGAGHKFVIDAPKHARRLMGRLRDIASAPSDLPTGLPTCALLPTPATLCDDTARKFFESLTMEFLHPLNVWFSGIAANMKPFQLCDARSVGLLFTPHAFMEFLEGRRRVSKPPLFTDRKFDDYSGLYRAFVRGHLFASWLEFQVWTHLEHELAALGSGSAEAASGNGLLAFRGTDAELTDMFITVHEFAVQELHRRRDPALALLQRLLLALKIILGSLSPGVAVSVFEDKFRLLEVSLAALATAHIQGCKIAC